MIDFIKAVPVWVLRVILALLSIVTLFIMVKITFGTVFITPWGHFGIADKGFVPANLDWTPFNASPMFSVECEYRLTVTSEPRESDAKRWFVTQMNNKPLTGMKIYATLVHQDFLLSTAYGANFRVEPASSTTASYGSDAYKADPLSLPITLEQRCPATKKPT